MSEMEVLPPEIVVHLVAPDGYERDYRMPGGITLAEFLRRSGTSTEDRSVLVDGAPPEDALPLRPGAVVTVALRSGVVAGNEPWRATIPAFRDEALFREYLEVIEAGRREADNDEDQGG